MLIDSHAHLDMEDFKPDLMEVLERARKTGISKIVTIGIDLESSRTAIELARDNPMIYATVGLHPHNANAFDMPLLQKLGELAVKHKVVGWGEIGLDFFKNYSPRERQLKAFRAQIRLARDLNLPVIIHDRDAHKETLEILKELPYKEDPGVIHCFSGDMDVAREFLALGYMISIPGTVTFKKAQTIREVAKSIPLESLLIETDSPFLAPEPFRGKRNQPAFVRYVAQEIARLRDMPLELLSEQVTKNTLRLFKKLKA